MTPFKRTLALLACLAAAPLTVGCQSTGPQANLASARDGVFIHLSKGPENPHAVLMALKMASLMSTDRDVLVYVDLKGVETVLKDAPNLTFPSFESSRAQIAGLLAKGVPIYVCPGCLKALNRKREDVMPGLRIAEKEAFFSFTRGRILTLDY
jgi:predicted peroxiredoxin